jgi:hypothetical protein
METNHVRTKQVDERFDGCGGRPPADRHRPRPCGRAQGGDARPFKRQFNLADYVQLFREVPEAMKPRRIAISGAPASNVHQIEGKAA